MPERTLHIHTNTVKNHLNLSALRQEAFVIHRMI